MVPAQAHAAATKAARPKSDVHDVARLVGVERRNAGRRLGQALEEGPRYIEMSSSATAARSAPAVAYQCSTRRA